MANFSLKFLTVIVFGITFLTNFMLAGILFLPAVISQMFNQNDDGSFNWLGFIFSAYGAQVSAYCVVAISMYNAHKLLPENWLPNLVNLTFSIPLIIISVICFLSVVLSFFGSGFTVYILPNIVSGFLCFMWATRPQK